MRDIKFRAWDSQGLDYCHSDEYDEKGLTRNECLAKFLDFNYGCELEQFTGLKDENGVEIYEGDVVKHNKIGIWSVEYSGSCFRLRMREGKNIYYAEKRRLLETYCPYGIEVIGNVHEETT